MRFVDDHQTVVTPADSRQVDAILVPAFTIQVGMIKHIIGEHVVQERVADLVALILQPVLA